jgi:putative intracellular protease/amidase
MSANLNRHGAPQRVLMVVANPAVSTTLGWPVGFWAAELTHAWYEFTEAGYDVTVASPDGGRVEIDALSDPRDASGYSAHDILSLGFLATPALAGLLERTPAIADVNPAAYDALYVAGGQSPMFTFREHAGLRSLIRAFWDTGRVVCVVCHGVAALLDLTLADGSFLIAGRHLTGFANSEEDFADQVVGRKVMPYRIEDVARQRGANFAAAPAFRPHAVRDGQLVTGQQQYSGRAAAELVISALGR